MSIDQNTDLFRNSFGLPRTWYCNHTAGTVEIYCATAVCSLLNDAPALEFVVFKRLKVEYYFRYNSSMVWREGCFVKELEMTHFFEENSPEDIGMHSL